MTPTRKPPVNRLNAYASLCVLLVGIVGCTASKLALAELNLSEDWGKSPSCYNVGPQPTSPAQQADWLGQVQRGERKSWFVCPPGEAKKVRNASKQYAAVLNAVPPGRRGEADFDLNFKLQLDSALYYVAPARFMARDKEGEICTPDNRPGAARYMCEEGQRQAQSCHLLFLNQAMEPAGSLRLRINEPYRYLCNEMTALEAADKSRNELLVTLQYFPIDKKPASKVSEIGSGWKRMTTLVRLRAENGKIVAEQDDMCLGNPNNFDSVQDARTALEICKERSHLAPVQLASAVNERNKRKSLELEKFAREKAPTKFAPWISSGFQLLSHYEGDLNGDGIDDAAIVLNSMDKSTRRLVILKGLTDATFIKTGQSDGVILCESCNGSFRTTEDPFKEVIFINNKIAVRHEVAGGDHWETSLVFAWSRRDNQWQLVEYVDSWSEPLEAKSRVCTYRPPRDFGKISIEKIDLERGFLGPKAKGSCKK
jgi:hypothetical protein